MTAMHISKINNIANGNVNKVKAGNLGSARKVSSAGNSSFDKISINSDCRENVEKRIASKMGKRVSNRVYIPRDNTDRIEEIKQSVKDGTYFVDVDRVAKNILMMRGE